MKWKHPALGVLAAVVFVGGIANFFVFMGTSAQLGGSASEGYVGDGYYFVGERGRYRAVPRETWEWSLWQGRSIWITHPLAMLAGAYVLFGWVFPRSIGRATADTDERVARVQASGAPIASTLCSARLGRLSLRGPLLAVRVHPGGVVLKPIFMPRRAIQASEITALEVSRQLWVRGLAIRHTAPDVASSVILYIGEESAVAQAIRGLIGGRS